MPTPESRHRGDQKKETTVQLDILIFAAIAAFLIYRLNSVLGTRSGNERQRPNPLKPADAPVNVNPLDAQNAVRPVPPHMPVMTPAALDQVVDAEANRDGRVEQGLADIRAEDAYFEINSFMQGARYAFELIVTAYARGDLGAIQPLVSPKLYNDFAAGVRAREAAGHTTELTLHRVQHAKIIEAHMGGTMAYVTVDFEVEESTVTRDKSGQVVDGNPDSVFNIRDIWTFTRDARTSDPNWILIETRSADQ